MRLTVVLAAAVVLLLTPSLAFGQDDEDRCAPRKAGEQCGEGNGRQTPGGTGTGKVSHKGWPKITGILWQVLDSGNHQRTGTEDNDELLGHHGNEKLNGGAGKDVLWGDWDPKNNTTRQSDVMYGGDGNDFIYPSHGKNVVYGGRGNDRVVAYYGKGTIDCGPGAKDYAQVRENGAYKTRNCEIIRHFCQYGSKPNGDCKKPGEGLALREPLRLVNLLGGLVPLQRGG